MRAASVCGTVAGAQCLAPTPACTRKHDVPMPPPALLAHNVDTHAHAHTHTHTGALGHIVAAAKSVEGSAVGLVKP